MGTTGNSHLKVTVTSCTHALAAVQIAIVNSIELMPHYVIIPFVVVSREASA